MSYYESRHLKPQRNYKMSLDPLVRIYHTDTPISQSFKENFLTTVAFITDISTSYLIWEYLNATFIVVRIDKNKESIQILTANL